MLEKTGGRLQHAVISERASPERTVRSEIMRHADLFCLYSQRQRKVVAGACGRWGSEVTTNPET